MAGGGDADPDLRLIQEDTRIIEDEGTLTDQEIGSILGQQDHATLQQTTVSVLPEHTCHDIPQRRRPAEDRSRLADDRRRLAEYRGRLAEDRRRSREALLSHRRRHPAGSPASSSRETGSTEFSPRVLLQQSILYSGPRGSRGRPRRVIEDHPGEVRSSELGCTSMDLSKIEALELNDTPHTLDSAERVVVHAETVDRGMLDSTIAGPSALEKEKPRRDIPRKYWPPKYEGSIKFAEKQAQSVQALAQYRCASKKELVLNAYKWMSEEVMLAFRRYIEIEEDLKGVEYEFGELLYQCFNVEHYFKTFHHFNFTVNMKKHGSDDWTSVMYFAEVKTICRIKDYVCYPLEPDENGQCYACQNQEMHELRHPSVAIFECGNEDTKFPYYCEESDSDEFRPITGGSESDDDMS